ncbi:ser/threonine protein phosphatase [Alicyclobacillus contaminans]|uniref:metallophosphoesterase n=1 Tax=Alicyclobacillus contaminans TaxID=392016 RepID=UPI0003F6195F|nr:metallophosphoesterase [Alicyclobacillus contaminans]GMA52498.1 ser/threonine protein phosphatase [Alicyclobacillus contaminans]
MAWYALGDVHLGSSVNKPMGIFGEKWEQHEQKIAEAWRRVVEPDDFVLVPGDISWAMTLQEAEPDLQFLGQLPGQKVFVRGNHDYWWNGIGKVRKILPSGCFAIQNDAISLGNYAIAGSRGWLLPDHPKFTTEDETIYRREIGRLQMSLERAAAFNQPIVVMMHYPPCGVHGDPTPFTELMEEFQVRLCVYGHLHGAAHRFAFEGALNGVDYRLVSADYVEFAPVALPL